MTHAYRHSRDVARIVETNLAALGSRDRLNVATLMMKVKLARPLTRDERAGYRRAAGAVRPDNVARAREMILSGTMDTPERLDAAAGRMLDAVYPETQPDYDPIAHDDRDALPDDEMPVIDADETPRPTSTPWAGDID